MICRMTVWLALMACSHGAWGFESWEHKKLGDLAYHLASRIYCIQHQDKPDNAICAAGLPQSTSMAQWLYDPLLATQNEAQAIEMMGNKYKNIDDRQKKLMQISYGDIVMCVDSFLSTEKLLAGRERSLINQTTLDKTDAASDPDIISAVQEPMRLLPSNAGELDIEYKSRCRDSLLHNLEGARAMHVNHTHFQAELLVAQRNNHLLALSMRTVEDNLFSALVVNAISDHFLQDSFAPGHITTWRNRLTDLAANAFHDKANRKTWTANIDGKGWRQITAGKSESETQAAAQPSLTRQVLAALQSGDELGDERTRYFFVMPVAEADSGCKDGCRTSVPTGNKRWLELEKLVEDLDNPAKEKKELQLRGDAYLWRPQQDEQRFVMLVLSVRSILDVLESNSQQNGPGNATVHVVDSFRENSWKWAYVKSEKVSGARTIDLIYNKWGVGPSLLNANIGALRYEMPHSGVASRQNPDQPHVDYRDMDSIYGIGLGADNMAFGDAQTRYLLTLETVIDGLVKPDKTMNWALTAGIQPYYSKNFSGAALISRLIFTRPEIETSVSIPFRMIHIKKMSGKSDWKPAIGLRLDVGFSSFLTFYLQTSWDSAAQLNGSIRSGPSLGAGIQVASPKCRALLIKHWCD